ncbi:MAG: hypothetical protein PVH89_03650 [Gammaproteobacteria bacterium]
MTRRSLLRKTLTAAGFSAAWAGVPRVLLAQDGDAEVTGRLQSDLQTHGSFGLKYSGSPGDHATADWTADRLRAIGYAVEVSEFDAPFFVSRTTALRTGETLVDVVPQAPVLVTGDRGVSAPLVIVEEDGEVGDVRGRIAVVILPFARHAALFPTRGIGSTVVAAAEAGAVGIILVTSGPSGEAIALNCPEDGPFVPVPLAILAPKDALPIIAAARAGNDATLVIDGEATHRPCKNTVGMLERGPEWIAMSTPRSGWYHCVAERGTGQAAFLEIAAWLERSYPEHSVFLMNTGAHEYFFAGSHRVLHHAPPPERTVAWAHIGATLAARDAVEMDGEWTMLDTVDPNRRTMSTSRAREAVVAGFAGLIGLDDPGIVQSQAGELSTFTDMGFESAFACIGLHRWFHTVGDTIDCVDARLLLPVVRGHQATLARLIDA